MNQMECRTCRLKLLFDLLFRGTQRQFSENICSEGDFRSRIFGTFVVKFLACLPLLGYSNTKRYNCPFLKDLKGHLEFSGAIFSG